MKVWIRRLESMMDLLKRNILSVFEEDDTEERMTAINKLLAQK